MTPSAQAPRSFRDRVLKAGSWSVLGHMGAQFLRLGSSLVLTRMLAPDLFGLMALMAVIMVVVGLLADIGVQQTVVQSERGSHPDMLDTAWAMSILRGLAIWVACSAVAGVILWMQKRGSFAPMSVYAAPELPLVIVVATFTAVIHGCASSNMFLAERALDQKPVALITFIGLAIQVVSMIIMAAFSKSVWPLVFGTYVGEIAYVALSHWWLKGRKVKFRLHREYALEIFRFGRWIIASSAMHVLALNGDRLLLGAWSTQSQLALYHIALTLAQAVDTVAWRLFSAVATPAFSEVVRSDPARLRQVYWKLRMRTDAAIVAASGFMVATGETIIRVLYDDRYHGAGDILKTLAFGLLFTRYSIAGSAYMALGHTKYLTIVSFVKLVALFALLPAAHHFFGIQGVYWAIALHLAVTVPVFLYLDHRHGLLSLRREAQLLLFWPLGYAMGWIVAWAVSRVLGWTP